MPSESHCSFLILYASVFKMRHTLISNFVLFSYVMSNSFSSYDHICSVSSFFHGLEFLISLCPTELRCFSTLHLPHISFLTSLLDWLISYLSISHSFIFPLPHPTVNKFFWYYILQLNIPILHLSIFPHLSHNLGDVICSFSIVSCTSHKRLNDLIKWNMLCHHSAINSSEGMLFLILNINIGNIS